MSLHDVCDGGLDAAYNLHVLYTRIEPARISCYVKPARHVSLTMQAQTHTQPYQPDLHAVYSSAVAGCVPGVYGSSMVQQAGTASGKHHAHASQQVTTPIAGHSQHSPDSSATLTGSGRCSDASDLTSSHPSNLPKHQHKRIKLGSIQHAQHELAHHASAQCPPDPNLMLVGSHDVEDAPMLSQQAVQSWDHPMRQLQHAAMDSQLHDCHVLFQPTLSPLTAHRPQNKVLHPIDCNSLPAKQHAPAYTPCMISGLTPAKQLLKDREEEELAQQLRQQQDIYTSGYTVDSCRDASSGSV